MGAKDEYKAFHIAQGALLKIIATVAPSDMDTTVERECVDIAATALEEINTLLGVKGYEN